MSENLKKFLEEASKNEELKAKLASLTDKENAEEKIVEIAKEYGFSLNAEDFKPVDGEELSLDQLDQVAGGGFFDILTDTVGAVLNWIDPFNGHVEGAK